MGDDKAAEGHEFPKFFDKAVGSGAWNPEEWISRLPMTEKLYVEKLKAEVESRKHENEKRREQVDEMRKRIAELETE